ncbi:MAG: DoxX family membrane protein [Chitinophagaceae bacterium]|nr:MAG: DoxX family membrane protein [Chitinophagaceae bacterium]
MKLLHALYGTRPHTAGPALRAALALVLLPHGCQLLFGWFGGFGFAGSMHYFTQVEGLPWLVGFGVIFLQFFGALLLLAGVLGRLLALCYIALFAGMIVTSHWEHGFFMNWMGTQKGEGFEYHLLAIGISLALLLSGSGRWSADALWTRRRSGAGPGALSPGGARI